MPIFLRAGLARGLRWAWLPLLGLLMGMLAPATVAAQQLTVSAAASLTDAFRELAARFEAGRPGVTVRLNFAASGVLLQQIANGAPVDLFVPADQATMDRAVDQKLVEPATRRNFAANTLVLVEPARGGVGVRALAELQTPQVRRVALGKPASVPAGRYSQQALESAGLWQALQPRIVLADNVRQVLDYVARGEVEAGLVYRTDALVMPERVRIALTVPGHTPVSYPLAVATDSRHKALAADFAALVLSPAGQQTLARFGFGRP